MYRGNSCFPSSQTIVVYNQIEVRCSKQSPDLTLEVSYSPPKPIMGNI